MDILKTVLYGEQYFEIAYDELEEVDKLLLRRILNAPTSACIESLYLELGLVPIHIIIKARRVKYLHYLVRLGNDILSKVFKTQWKYPVKDDWTTTVQKDLKNRDIGLDIHEIKEKSDYSFRS